MREYPTLDEVVAAVSSEASNLEDLSRRLIGDATKAEALVRTMTRHDAPQVRMYAADLAVLLPQSAALSVLRQLAGDRNPDVRDVALGELLEHYPEAASTYRGKFRASLESRDVGTVQFALTALARLRDVDALDRIRSRGAQEPLPSMIRKWANLVAMILEGRQAEILDSLIRHEHNETGMLARAAEIVGTPEALTALDHCASEAPDEQCRLYCSRSVAELRRSLRHRI